MRYSMTSETIALPFPAAQLSYQGIDLNDDGAWLAVVETAQGLRLRTAGTDVKLPLNLQYAMVRWLGDKALVVFSRIRDEGDINAWVVNVWDGTILNKFSVGDGVNNVVVLEDFIVVGYFDEGVYSDNPLSNEGVSVFDRNGVFQWGYTSSVADPVLIDDCYAICKIGRNAVSFCAYSDFKLVELDVTARQQAVTTIPEELEGANAITTLPHTTFFYGPYCRDADPRKDRAQAYAFDRASGAITNIGQVPGTVLNGLSEGRLLSLTDRDALIIRFSQQEGGSAAAI